MQAQGNAAFAAQNFQEAVKYFSQAIDIDGSNHVLYSNRSAAYVSFP
jgi:stress-induced-phosphoprotein 1